MDKDAKINVGDLVLTNGGTSFYHKDMIIGEITRIIKKPSDYKKSAEIRILIDYSRLENVFIIKKKPSEILKKALKDIEESELQE